MDVDHGDATSKNSKNSDPYEWLKTLSKYSSMIHLKQRLNNNYSHYPFTDEYNKKGKIRPEKVLNILKNYGDKDSELILEHSFKERQPFDKNVIPLLKESVNYWKYAINNFL